MAYWRQGAGMVLVAVKVQPKSRRPGVQGLAPDIEGERLRIGVAEPAEDGRANRAVCDILARALDLPAAAISVTHGKTSRQKTIQIDGPPDSIASKLEALCPPP
jgi:uncharacterized protein (TIGR00251 family)